MSFKLFSSLNLGGKNSLELNHRVVMAPLTRFRAVVVSIHIETCLNLTVACKQLRPFFKGPIIAAGGFTRKTAIEMVENGDADLVAFGRHFISNPDLPNRLEKDLPLNMYDRETFYYAGGDIATGYTDYPFYGE